MTMQVDATTKLFGFLHRGGAFAHWWTPDSGKFFTNKKTGAQEQAKFSLWFPVDRPLPVPAAWREKNIYFCVHPQSSIPQRLRADGSVTDQKYVKAWLSHVAAINCLFGEFDVKDYGSKEKISAHLHTLSLYPSVIVDSGGGFHCYWLLANTVTVTDDNRNHIKRLQYAWVKLMGSDDDAKDLARVLRVPGTLNRKEKYAPNYPTVTIIEADYNRLYSLEEFERLTEHLRQEKPHTPYTGSHSVTDDIVTAAENLKRLSPSRRDRYQDWMNVGFALKALGSAGLQLWDEWSRGSAKYTDGACAAKWEKMSESGLGLGSLIMWANDDDPAGKRAYTNGTNGHSKKDNMLVKTHPQVEKPIGTAEPTTEIDVTKYRAEDGGILDAWVDCYSNKWIFATGNDRWHYWNGTCWQPDDRLIIQREVRELLDTINQRCSQYIIEASKQTGRPTDTESNTNIEIVKAMRKASKRTNGRISSIEGMARSVNTKPISAFDMQDSINLINGTLNLHSLELQPHSRDDLFTYQLDYQYDPNAKCPQWEKYISEVLVKDGTLETDTDLVSLFQELLGYSLTTQTKRQVMIWMYGDGGNGKSVAVDAVQALLGPMATTVDFQSIGLPGNYDLADIPGKRVIFSTEAEKGGAVSEKHIKCIVTGDPLKARPIYGSPIEFRSTAKIWWAMNDRPIVKDTSDSMWRRMKLIPFLRKFEEGKNADVDLPQKLRTELPGILNWAIQGLIRLTLNDGFTYSEAAESAKLQYREESNPVARWVNTMTVRTEYPATLQGALFDNFKGWLSAENEKPITSNQFGRDLGRLKISKTRRDKGFMYHLALIGD